MSDWHVGRRLEDHLPPVAVEALKAESEGTGYSVREIVLLALANDLLQRGTVMRNTERISQALALLHTVLDAHDLPRRRGSDALDTEDV